TSGTPYFFTAQGTPRNPMQAYSAISPRAIKIRILRTLKMRMVHRYTRFDPSLKIRV
ncbi:MAG: hypothetical protein IIB05_11760, partial [Bacteroidetes bacterium]|nr:hypothetical protein [Bacteroidota bacterium]